MVFERRIPSDLARHQGGRPQLQFARQSDDLSSGLQRAIRVRASVGTTRHPPNTRFHQAGDFPGTP